MTFTEACFMFVGPLIRATVYVAASRQSESNVCAGCEQEGLTGWLSGAQGWPAVCREEEVSDLVQACQQSVPTLWPGGFWAERVEEKLKKKKDQMTWKSQHRK